MMLLLFACFSKQGSPETVGAVSAPVQAQEAIPEVPVAKDFYPPEPSLFSLSNGSQLWLLEKPELPLLVLNIVLPGGYGSDGDQWGRSDLAAEMLSQSAGNRSAREVSSALHKLATSVGVSSYSSNTVVSISMHKDRIQDVLPIVSDMMYRPAFSDEDWNRIRGQAVLGAEQIRQDPRSIGYQYSGYFYHGSDHPLGTPSYGTPTSLAALDKEDVQRWHQERLVGQEISFVVVGDISSEAAIEGLQEHFPEWSGQSFAQPTPPPAQEARSGEVLLIDMPGAQQTTIRIVSNAYDVGSADSSAANQAARIMGGSFTSRLNSLLREEKGYTYGIGCGFSETRFGATFAVSTSVRTDVTTEALQDIYATLNSAIEGFSTEEVQKSKVLDRTDRIESVESRASIAGMLTSMVIMNRSTDHQRAEISAVSAVTAEDMKTAGQYLLPERGLTLLIGDAEQIKQPLLEAGFSIEEVGLPE